MEESGGKIKKSPGSSTGKSLFSLEIFSYVNGFTQQITRTGSLKKMTEKINLS